MGVSHLTHSGQTKFSLCRGAIRSSSLQVGISAHTKISDPAKWKKKKKRREKRGEEKRIRLLYIIIQVDKAN